MATTIAILEIATGNSITLPYNPAELNVEDTANLTSVGVRGTNNVQQQFVNASRQITFTVDAPALRTTTDRYYENALNIWRFLSSLTKEDNTNGFPRVRIQWASLFAGTEWIMPTLSTKMTEFRSFLDFAPTQLDMSLTFIEQPLNPRSKTEYGTPYQNQVLRAFVASQQFILSSV